jgi:hypothetical protein
VNRRPQLRLVAPHCSPEEAAAVVAALEQFMRQTAPIVIEAGPDPLSPWQQAALAEGVQRLPELPAPWM